MDWTGQFDRIDRGNLVPRPNRPIPIWIGGFSDPAFRRGVNLGDGFIFAGNIKRGLAGLDRLRQLGAKADRDMTGFGLEFLRPLPSSPAETLEDMERWREAGGTHFSVVTMNMGLDSLEAHLDFIAEVKAGVH